MENLSNWLNKPLDFEEVELWFNANNIILEKVDLYYDFSISLLSLMNKTYLGFSEGENETKIRLSEEDNLNHFNWCWGKTVENFKKENILFEIDGEHYQYFETFFKDIFYNEKNSIVREGLNKFFHDLFNIKKTFTKADLDLLTDLYKTMEKNTIHR